MPHDLDNSVQIEQLGQAKALLNRLLQSLDDQNDNASAACEELQLGVDPANSHETTPEPTERQLTPSEEHVHSLTLQRDALIGRLQREEYLSGQFEEIIERHQAILKIVKANLQNRLQLERQVGATYEENVKRTVAGYHDNSAKLEELSREYKRNYANVVETVRRSASELNEEL